MQQKFTVIGYPIGHTMSPFIHGRLFAMSGISAEYGKLEISPSELCARMPELRGLNGFNVTIPHKQAIIPLIDRLDESAALFGAVNTVACDRQTVGHNTDAYGFLGALEGAGIPLEGRVLVCGTGGAARTIAVTAARQGCRVTVAVRESSLVAAKLLCAELRDKFGADAEVSLLSEISDGFDLCVNATPAGMFPKVGASPLTGDQIGRCKALFDAVYNPRETALMSMARERGVTVCGGMPMLVMQAARAHEIWYGARFTRGEIAAVIRDAESEMERIFSPSPSGRSIVLCGFMGSGKSTVGRMIAGRMGRTFIDTDEYISEKAGMSIPDIFAKTGEDGFREMEHMACAELAGRADAVIATGGGALTFSRNSALFSGKADVFFLDLPFSSVMHRVGDDASRPLMNSDAGALFERRRPLYAAASDFTVDADLPPEEVAANIINLYHQKGEKLK
jgi:shikimate dehydrogenase